MLSVKVGVWRVKVGVYGGQIPLLSLSYLSVIYLFQDKAGNGRRGVLFMGRMRGEWGVNGKTLRFRVPVFKFRLPLQMGI